MNQSAKYKLGSLIVINKDRKFPVVLRDGPGYTFSRVEVIEPGDVGIVLSSMIGHGMNWWTFLYVSIKDKKGWIPEGVTDYIINNTLNDS